MLIGRTWAAPLIAILALGCSGEEKTSGVAQAKLPTGTDVSVKHEECSESGNRVEVLDSNNDGKPDIKRVYDKSAGRELCHIADINHDGKPELYEYFDQGGQIRRREFVYDDSGVVASVEIYEGGKLARRESDTAGLHRIDTIDIYDPSTGKRVKRERDTNGDGRMDQWWAFGAERTEITMDKNGDGQPDPEATIVIGPKGEPILPDAGAPQSASGSSEGGGPPPPPPPPVLFENPPPPLGDAGAKKGTNVKDAGAAKPTGTSK